MSHIRKERWLIVNGDDFGLSLGINRAISEAHRDGILTSASPLATGDAFDEAATAARAHPDLAIGLHLALIEGTAVLAPQKIPSLASADGRLAPSLQAFLTRWLLGRIDLSDVEREFAAQMEKALDAGVQLHKLDSHMHIHLMPRIFRVVLAVARRYGIRWIRLPKIASLEVGHLDMLTAPWKLLALSALSYVHERAVARAGVFCPDHFAGLAESGRLTEKNLVRILQHLGPGVTEIMVHPGYPEHLSDAWPQSHRYKRHGELTALTSPRVKNLINTVGIKLMSYRDVQHNC